MKCLKCSGATLVSNTVSDGKKIYRHRRCKVCGHSFYTTEEVSDCKYILLKLRDEKRRERELNSKKKKI